MYCSPHTEDIERFILSKYNYSNDIKVLHIVPTMILLRRRIQNIYRNLKPFSGVRDKISDREIREFYAIYELDEFSKTIVYQNAKNILSKSESSVIVERILQNHSFSNNLAWKSVTTDLRDYFIELNQTGLEIEQLRSFDESEKWQNIMTLYEDYLSALLDLKKQDHGQALFNAINSFPIEQFDELILDGAFIPIRSRHHRLIERFQQNNKPVTLLLPYDTTRIDHPAQKVIKTTYEPYVPLHTWGSIQEPKPSSFFVDQLPKKIFTNESPVFLDSTFELLRFSTFENELNHIVQKINVLIRRKGVKPREIVIVTPNAMELRPLVREVSQQYQLRVELPRRPIMQLSVGRGIKVLFDTFTDIRRNGGAFLPVQALQTLIQSELIKGTKRLKTIFHKVDCFFEDCSSFDEWFEVLNKLIDSKKNVDPIKYSQHPLTHIEEEFLYELVELLKKISYISSKLLSSPTITVKEHISNFMQFLLHDPVFENINGELAERLVKIFSALETQDRIPLTAIEFGERVASLFTEQEEYEPGNIAPTETDDGNLSINRGILVTGPNNVEFQRYEYVFLCRFTQDVYPEPRSRNWIQSKQVERSILMATTKLQFNSDFAIDQYYMDRAIYHLNLVFSAATTKITISYSQMDNGLELTHAHYLHDIAKVFGIQEGDRSEDKSLPTLEKLLEMSNVLRSPEHIVPLSNNSDERSLELTRFIKERQFTVEDIAIYQYCARRLYYQKKYPQEHTYHNLFHLQAYASSCLYEKAVELLVSKYPGPITENDTKRYQNELLDKVASLRKEAETYVRPIFPVSIRIWRNVISQTEFFLSGLINNIFDHPYVREHRKKGNSSVTIQLFLSSTPREIHIGDLTFLAHKELEVKYNGGRIHRYSISNLKDFLFLSSKEYSDKKRMDELKNWYFKFIRQLYQNDVSAISVLEEIAQRIKQGNFQKTTGGHCKFCTFNKLCQEREVD